MSLKVYKRFGSILFIALCILSVTSRAFGNCNLWITENISLRPNILLSIGTRKVDLILNKGSDFVTLFETQELEAHCDTEFETPFTSENSIKIKCDKNGNLYAANTNLNSNYDSVTLKCSPQKWILYESVKNFVWCPSNTTSYFLARPTNNEMAEFQYLAGVCYDIQHLSFKSLYYTLIPQRSQHLHPKALTDSYSPSTELKHLKETFSKKNIIKTDYGNLDVQNWLNFTQYNYSSVIQNAIVLKEFSSDQLGSILDVVWWPSLRLGNWKRYEKALARHVESEQESYDVMAGVSGLAAVPIIETCQTNYTLKELNDNKYNEVPMYIWNYLTSTKNSSDEIVVIAFNSPFYEFYAEQDVVFCSDKCHEIPWLKKVSSTFRYSPLGIIFCCSSQDVKMSKGLDGFP